MKHELDFVWRALDSVNQIKSGLVSEICFQEKEKSRSNFQTPWYLFHSWPRWCDCTLFTQDRGQKLTSMNLYPDALGVWWKGFSMIWATYSDLPICTKRKRKTAYAKAGGLCVAFTTWCFSPQCSPKESKVVHRQQKMGSQLGHLCDSLYFVTQLTSKAYILWFVFSVWQTSRGEGLMVLLLRSRLLWVCTLFTAGVVVPGCWNHTKYERKRSENQKHVSVGSAVT